MFLRIATGSRVSLQWNIEFSIVKSLKTEHLSLLNVWVLRSNENVKWVKTIQAAWSIYASFIKLLLWNSKYFLESLNSYFCLVKLRVFRNFRCDFKITKILSLVLERVKTRVNGLASNFNPKFQINAGIS